MNDKRSRLPAEVAAELPDDVERDRLSALWSALEAAAPRATSGAEDREAMWATIASATFSGGGEARVITTLPPVLPTPPSVIVMSRARPRRWPVAFGLAASLLLAVGLVSRPGAWEDVRAPRAEVTRITLPDGSTVELDAGSSLRFRRAFRGWGGGSRGREVVLQGSAFFSVKPDGRPFEVRTYNATVRVLGTSFSVDARAADSGGTSVEVTQGRVRLQVADRPSAVVLSVGERSRVPHAARAPLAASAVSIDRVAPWRTGGFVALDEPLARVVRALERRFDATIAIADTSVASRRVSLYYPASVSLERILSDLATTQALRWERRVNGYVIE